MNNKKAKKLRRQAELINVVQENISLSETYNSLKKSYNELKKNGITKTKHNKNNNGLFFGE